MWLFINYLSARMFCFALCVIVCVLNIYLHVVRCHCIKEPHKMVSKGGCYTLVVIKIPLS